MSDVTPNQVVINSPQTGPDAPVDTGRPEHVPEKFWDPASKSIRQDDLLKSYSELEKQFHAQRQSPDLDATRTAQSADGADPAGTGDVPGAAEAGEALAKQGLDLSKYEQEFSEKRELSEESFAELEKAGIPKAMVDAYIAGQQAVASKYDAEIYGAVGGEESYSSMVNWAKGNLTEAEAKVFDEAVTSGDTTKALMAVHGLKARYVEAEGINPSLVTGTRSGHSTTGYGNTAEMEADMNDVRYRRGDPAFHKYVDQRLAATTAF